MNLNFNSPIEYLKGVGPQKGKLLRDQLQIETVSHLLEYFPFRYIDKTKFTPIREVDQDGQFYQIKATLNFFEELGISRSKRLRAIVEDETGRLELVWFQNYQWIQEKLNAGQTYKLFGRVKITGKTISMAHPEFELFLEGQQLLNMRWEPVYSSNEKLTKRGLDSRGIKKLLFQAFQEIKKEDIEETLPAYIIEKFKLLPRYNCLLNIHFPKDEKLLHHARQRLKFEELFFLQLRIVYNMMLRKRKSKGYRIVNEGELFEKFFPVRMPFQLTSAQARVIQEIRTDLMSGIQMNRLLQGDVGSGKTMVAFLSMLMMVSNGYQCCIIAPTEVLAQQHVNNIRPLLTGLGLESAFLSSSIKGKERKTILDQLLNGTIHILVGTHALLEDKVIYQRLGMVVIDEQHRFGVEQRAKFWSKAQPYPPHVLVMTATPIPRTLAMSLYGDLDVSVIDELPPNRKSIITMHFTEALRGKLYEFMTRQITQGQQVYIVYPLIEESEKLDIENLEMGYERLLEYFPISKYQIAVVHGRLHSRDKEWEMQRFINGTSQIMVATTVIEVGVDVPNASIMVIENAERFGLSQLHQLRGRVGRGAEQSYCVLITNNQISKDAKSRIQTMVNTSDGFEIAEADLKLRGPGDLDGTRQSGLLHLKVANVVEDQKIHMAARKMAEAILKKDFELKHPLNSLLKQQLGHQDSINLGQIS